MYNTEAYLKQFTPEQRLKAFMDYLVKFGITELPLSYLYAGFDIAQPDGWTLVAPDWMKEFETEGIKPLSEFVVSGCICDGTKNKCCPIHGMID